MGQSSPTDAFAACIEKLEARAASLSHKNGEPAAAFSADDLPGVVRALGRGFRLSKGEELAIGLAIAPVYAPALLTSYAALSGRQKPCPLNREALAALVGVTLLEAESLFRHVLVEPGAALKMRLLNEHEKTFVLPSAELRSWLAGRDTLPEVFSTFATLLPHEELAEPILAAAEQQQFDLIRGAWARGGQPPLTLIYGRPGCGRTLIARHLAATGPRGVLKVDTARAPVALDALELEREARWLGAVILLRVSDEGFEQGWVERVRTLVERNVPLVLSLPRHVEVSDLIRAPHVRIQLDWPSQEVRRRLWARFLPQTERSEGLTDEQLAFRFRGTGRDIEQLALQAIGQATLERPNGHKRSVVSALHVMETAYRALVTRLGGLGTLLPPIQGGLDTLVLPDQELGHLDEVVVRVRRRQQVLEDWGFSEGRSGGHGTVVLMSGPPGTGKTLSARAVASELGIPLYRIDISRLVSKWVGETEKHLSAVFDDAERSGAALLFDEADSLFAKRTSVSSSNDRFANLESGYLLQRIEEFTGLCFLTTNLEASIDSAFIRRFALHIRYAQPTEQERFALWQRAIPGNAPLDADVDLEGLAMHFDQMSGSQIHNAAMRAAYLAAEAGTSITHEVLHAAASREIAAAGSLVRVVDWGR